MNLFFQKYFDDSSLVHYFIELYLYIPLLLKLLYRIIIFL